MTGARAALLLMLAGCGLQPVELLTVSQQPAAPSGETVLGTPPEAALARLRAEPDNLGDEGIELTYPAPPELVLPADLAPIDFAWLLGAAPKPPPMPPMPAPMAGMPAPPPPDPMKDKDKPPPAAADPVIAYELRASGPYAQAYLYVAAPGGAFPRRDWSLLLRQNIGQSVQIRLRGLRASGLFVHAKPLKLQVRPPLPAGTFYAFSTTARGLMRGELNRTHEQLVVPDGSQDWGCTGCHAVSGDGKRMLAAVGSGASLRSWQRASGAARSEPSELGAGYAFASFDRSAARIARIQAGRLAIFNADTSVLLDQTPAPLRAAVEALDWSPDGRTIALVLQGDKPDPDAARGGSLASVSVALEDGRLSAPQLLYTAPKDEMLLWPSFSPDGAYIAFEKRKGATRDAKDGKLFLLRAEGGEPIELLALRDKPMASAGAPAFVQGAVPELPYLVFSSRRPVGGVMPAEGQRQLFASALDLALADAGKDPSHAAFWLPFQQRTSSYLRAQWAPEPRECTAYAELCDELDDDCDGNVDEDCCRPAAAESCDNQQDDDCDGAVDEGCSCLPRELCGNQKDDDCDLRTDEQPCTAAPPGK